MISFYTWIVLKGFFRNLKVGSFLVKNLLFLAVAIFYAFIFAMLPQIMQAETGDHFFKNYFISSIIILVFIYSFSRIIFPSYKSIEEFFPNYLSVSNWKRYHFIVVKDLLQPAYSYLIIFIIALPIFGVAQPVELLILSIHAMIFGASLKRSIQFLIDYQRHFFSILGLLINLILVGITYYFIVHNNWNWLVLPSTWLSVCIGYFQYFKLKQSEKREFAVQSKSLYLKLILNNKRVRKMMLIGFVFKIAMLLIFLTQKNEIGTTKNEFSFLIFASPLILFTYIFNNQWGYFRSMWINLELHGRSIKRFFHFIIQVLKWLVLIDAIISIYLLILYTNDLSFSLLYYGLTLCLLFTFSFVWSIAFPVQINTKTNYKGTASLISVLGSFLIVFFVSLIQQEFWLPWIVGISIVLSVLAYYFSTYLYDEKRYVLFTKLFKE